MNRLPSPGVESSSMRPSCASTSRRVSASPRPVPSDRWLPPPTWRNSSNTAAWSSGPIPIPLSLIRWLFRRVALTYGFVIMPRRDALRLGRASALRELLRALEAGPIAITPEGLQASGRLMEPQEGVGRFLGMASRREPLLPAGVWEDDEGALHVRFGPVFRLPRATHELPGPEEDRRMARDVMVEIGRLLPAAYWGAYEDDLRTAEGAPVVE